ncbi:tetratricopeptide repeat protein [Phormidium sp. CCY1219]|uniref:tetratricopeptide repeat protein n=1 Tax=Phormidium sp. CCY1219 TaxID=2886104 RepID=UPI002D1EF5FE|nr:hypothetical protein [Phormidium sp. CCY1219]MEB3826129.1 hypothetical protein [Phormidium sp. CCY1219]
MTRILVATATVTTLVGLFPEPIRSTPSKTIEETRAAKIAGEYSAHIMPSPKQSNRRNGSGTPNNFGNLQEFMRAAPFFLQGNAMLQNKDYQGAIEQYNRAISNYSEYAEAYAQRGVARNQIGDRSGAIEDLQQAVNLFDAQGEYAASEKAQEMLEELQQ